MLRALPAELARLGALRLRAKLAGLSSLVPGTGCSNGEARLGDAHRRMCTRPGGWHMILDMDGVLYKHAEVERDIVKRLGKATEQLGLGPEGHQDLFRSHGSTIQGQVSRRCRLPFGSLQGPLMESCRDSWRRTAFRGPSFWRCRRTLLLRRLRWCEPRGRLCATGQLIAELGFSAGCSRSDFFTDALYASIPNNPCIIES